MILFFNCILAQISTVFCLSVKVHPASPSNVVQYDYDRVNDVIYYISSSSFSNIAYGKIYEDKIHDEDLEVYRGNYVDLTYESGGKLSHLRYTPSKYELVSRSLGSVQSFNLRLNTTSYLTCSSINYITLRYANNVDILVDLFVTTSPTKYPIPSIPLLNAVAASLVNGEAPNIFYVSYYANNEISVDKYHVLTTAMQGYAIQLIWSRKSTCFNGTKRAKSSIISTFADNAVHAIAWCGDDSGTTYVAVASNGTLASRVALTVDSSDYRSLTYHQRRNNFYLTTMQSIIEFHPETDVSEILDVSAVVPKPSLKKLLVANDTQYGYVLNQENSLLIVNFDSSPVDPSTFLDIADPVSSFAISQPLQESISGEVTQTSKSTTESTKTTTRRSTITSITKDGESNASAMYQLSDLFSPGTIPFIILVITIVLIVLSITLYCYKDRIFIPRSNPMRFTESKSNLLDLRQRETKRQDAEIPLSNSNAGATGNFSSILLKGNKEIQYKDLGDSSSANPISIGTTALADTEIMVNTKSSVTGFGSSDNTTTVSAVALNIPAYKLMNIKDIDLDSNEVAEGGFATIQAGTLKNTQISRRYNVTRVAVKLLKETGDEKEDDLSRQSLIQEIAMIEMVQDCKNIIQLIGFCDHPLAIVFKFYDYGTLDDFLIKKRTHPMVPYDINFVTYILHDIAFALKNLHTIGIAHCDLKPSNILIDFDHKYRPIGVVCDFGMANVVNEKLMGVKAFKNIDQRGGSLFYLSPEMLGEVEVKTSSLFSVDVYAYGIMAFCTSTRRKPWGEVGKEAYVEMIKKGKRPYFNSSQTWNEFIQFPFKDDYRRIVEKCWDQSPQNRPNMSSIYEEVKEMALKARLEL